MNLKTIFERPNPSFSFEIFPPKPTSPIDTVYNTLEQLSDLSPDYISVTFRAGSSVKDNMTAEVCGFIKQKLRTEPLAHLTCVGSTKEYIDAILERLAELGVNNVLALRGDKREDLSDGSDFTYATDLIKYIKEKGNFNVVAACYPEMHTEAASFDEDIAHMKEKADLGVSHFITQLFFDNDKYYDFLDRCAKANIKTPIEVGIMPITSAKQLDKMANTCGAEIPKECLKMVEKYGDDPVAMRDAGIIYATNQIMELVSNGIDGVHVYTMNNPYVARKIELLTQSIFKR